MWQKRVTALSPTEKKLGFKLYGGQVYRGEDYGSIAHETMENGYFVKGGRRGLNKPQQDEYVPSTPEVTQRLALEIYEPERVQNLPVPETVLPEILPTLQEMQLAAQAYEKAKQAAEPPKPKSTILDIWG